MTLLTYARIIDGVAVDVCHDPDTCFHPVVAEQFAVVPPEVMRGWRLVDGEWTAPEPVPTPEPVVEPKKVSPIEFKLLFTSSERVAITAARATDAVVDDFFGIIDDPRLTEVDLRSNGTGEVIEHLVEVGLVSGERQDSILNGIAP